VSTNQINYIINRGSWRLQWYSYFPCSNL